MEDSNCKELNKTSFIIYFETVLSGGPLQSDYELLQIHAHWGNGQENGSEHTVDGKQFSSEVGLKIFKKALTTNLEAFFLFCSCIWYTGTRGNMPLSKKQ